jgi:hypothetical protein
MALFARPPAAKPLRLIALEADDLLPLSALLQDGVLRVGDMAYDKAGRHFTLRLNRFCHESGGAMPLRAPSVLRISCVTRVQMRHLDPAKSQQVLSLLDLEAETLDAPACALTLRFAGDAAPDVRVEAECIDVLLMDLAVPRRAKSTPQHS